MPTRHFKRAALALFAATACVDQRSIAPNANAVIVQSVLDAGADDQLVIVQTTNGAVNQQKAVAGATVVIYTPDGHALSAEEVHDSTLVIVRSEEPRVTTVYRFRLSRFAVTLVPGGTYALAITLPDGRAVRGTTTIPNVAPHAAFSSVDSLSRSRGDSLSLAWPRVAGASGYQVTVSSPQYTLSQFADTAITLTLDERNPYNRIVFYPNTTNRVTVSAVDRNYYDYYRKNSDLFTGEGLIIHLDGATGVFGSIVPIDSRAVFVQ